jgi:hypothetical protein
MRRLVALAVILAVAVFALGAAGCGSDKPQAKAYMNKGDAAMAKAMPSYNDIETKISKLASDLNNGAITDPNVAKASVAEIQGLVKKTETDAADAKVQFEKILDLKGVNDYAEYADIAIKTIDKMKQVDATILELVGMIEAFVTTGQAPDVTKIVTINNELETLGGQLQDLVKQAETLKSEKNL